MKRKLPWIDKNSRHKMEVLRTDLVRQAARAHANKDFDRQAELEQHILTITRELNYDEELRNGRS